ncbi:MAG: SDR family NAD(P)-dependent oxidoreductase [Proteobacteria bacterium]|jgi:3-oxoacyl-[acyl-carrier protein] reductase|nr:SDR family NAD(P)-dependent oxidoreductase [Pseudomonadota bacterium]
MTAGRLSGRVALVTGAARGVGRATAEKLAREGAAVFLNDIDADALEQTASECGGIAVPGDLTQPNFPDALIGDVLQRRGTLDIVVNNAGYIWNSALHNHADEQWDAMLDIHVTAPFRILRAYGRWLREVHKSTALMPCRKVVNVSSVSGLFGAATQAGYAAGKAAVVGLTRTLAKEWGRYNVTVNAVAFGHIATRLTQAYAAEPPRIEVAGRSHRVGLTQEQIAQQLALTPLGRTGTAEDAANAIYLFCQSESDFVTGEVLVASGGLRM